MADGEDLYESCWTYHSLQIAHKQTLKNLARLVAVSYILESLR